jgi:RND family efflux transporter MFP subunit
MKPLVAALVALAALSLVGCQEARQTKGETPPRPVLVAQIHYQPRQRAEALPGVVKARVESDLGFRVAGKIAVRLVDAGATVKQGDALARLDDADLRLQLEQAEAEAASARAARDQAEAEERRITTLSRQGWAANVDFDRVRSAADQARNAVIRAERAATLARNALDYATLTADAAGVISQVAAEPGQVVAAGQPIVRLARTAEREAAVSVPETLVDRVRVDAARVAFWALPSVAVAVAARLRELSPTADPATRTYPARFALIDAPDSVRLGMSVTVDLSAEGAPVARAPVGAIFDSGKGPMAWRVDAATGALTAVSVTIAGYDSEFAFIAGGLSEGDEIVAIGVHKLDRADKVRVVESLAGL